MLEAALRRAEGEYRRWQGQRDHLHYCAGMEIHALRAGGITGTVATALGVRCNRGLVGLLSKGFGARVRVFGGRAAVGRAGLIHDPAKTWGPRGHQRDQHETTNACVEPSHSLGFAVVSSAGVGRLTAMPSLASGEPQRAAPCSAKPYASCYGATHCGLLWSNLTRPPSSEYRRFNALLQCILSRRPPADAPVFGRR